MAHTPWVRSPSLSSLQIRHLQALQAVVEAGSFRAAAERLGYAQPSVSAQIAALERIVSARLVERANGRPVSLTAAGEAFYAHAVEVMGRLQTGADRALAVGESPAARLRLGTYPSVAAKLLPGLLVQLADRWPDAEVRLTEATGPEPLETALEHGQLDLAFAVQPFGRSGIAGVALVEDPFVLVVPADGALASRDRPVSLDDLAGLDLILSGGCAHLQHLEARLRLRGHEPQVRVHTDDDGLAHGLVAAGAGMAILASLQVDVHRTDTTAVLLADVLPPRVVALAWRADRALDPVAEAFVALARDIDVAAQAAAGASRTVRRATRTASTVNTASATHTSAKPARRESGIGSA